MKEVVNTLFPEHPIRPKRPVKPINGEIPLFTAVEVLKAVSSLKNKKSPDPDGLLSEIVKAMARTHVHLLLNMYNSCLTEGIFPARWKIAKLVLLYKGKGPVDAPSSQRPLCMLDSVGKGLEKLIKNRLLDVLKKAGDLSPQRKAIRFQKRKAYNRWNLGSCKRCQINRMWEPLLSTTVLAGYTGC